MKFSQGLIEFNMSHHLQFECTVEKHAETKSLISDLSRNLKDALVVCLFR